MKLKQLLLIILVVPVFFIPVGCNENETYSGTSDPITTITPIPKASISPVEIKIPESVTPESELHFYMVCYDDSKKYIDRTRWQNYIKEKFDIEIYASYKNKNTNAVKFFRYESGGGDVWASSSYQRLDYKVNELSDISSYYDEYEWNEIIDDFYLDYLKRGDAIFAVPAESIRYIIPRYYNAEYLRKLNLDVPTTINGFYEYLNKSQQINNLDSDFYPICLRRDGIYQGLSDIFRGFDIYVNTDRMLPCAYNPNTGAFEDGLFSENALDALTFIRQLQLENKVIVRDENNRDSSSGYSKYYFDGILYKMNKNFATEYMGVYDKNNEEISFNRAVRPGYEYETGYYLSHLNKANLIKVHNDVAIYTFPKTIGNLDSVMELFNMVMTEDELYNDLKYGREGIDFEIIDTDVKVNEPKKGGFLGLLQLRKTKIIGFSHIEYPEELFYNSHVYNEFLGNDIRSHFAANYSSNYSSTFIFYKDVSPDDALERYRNYFFKQGLDKGIFEMNERIGQVPAYDYSQNPDDEETEWDKL